ncbi:hypothetical protein Tco_0353089 [Tanacetum coccineum]
MLDRLTCNMATTYRLVLSREGKENGVNILKSIDKGPFEMGTFRETLAEGNEGALHLGPERARVYSNLSPEDKDRYNADIRATNILLQGLPKDIYTLINHYTDAKDIWDNVKTLLEGSELTKEDCESQLHMPMRKQMLLNDSLKTTVDPLALMSNVSHQQYYSQSSTTPPSTHHTLLTTLNLTQDSLQRTT